MTPSTADHSQMSVEEFEQVAHRTPETVKLEFINGKLEVKPVPDGDHGTIIVWLMRQCMRQLPELDVYGEQGLKIESYRQGRARPDAVLVPSWCQDGTSQARESGPTPTASSWSPR
ncbi:MULTISPECIES: Uma2 family endonuclease [unclassified Streptomyces]|uniref:Uma2 family endonuclease n=1 Tax=unclassified Streptomyces TaxID=2593676 RepID=UPI00386DB001